MASSESDSDHEEFFDASAGDLSVSADPVPTPAVVLSKKLERRIRDVAEDIAEMVGSQPLQSWAAKVPQAMPALMAVLARVVQYEDQDQRGQVVVVKTAMTILLRNVSALFAAEKKYHMSKLKMELGLIILIKFCKISI